MRATGEAPRALEDRDDGHGTAPFVHPHLGFGWPRITHDSSGLLRGPGAVPPSPSQIRYVPITTDTVHL